MNQYGVFLMNKDELKHAGLITIDPSGVLIIKGGKEKWDLGTFKNVQASLNLITLKEPLYKKYAIDATKEVLPETTQKYEARRLTLDINFYGMKILQHEVGAYPVTIDDSGKLKKIEYND